MEIRLCEKKRKGRDLPTLDFTTLKHRKSRCHNADEVLRAPEVLAHQNLLVTFVFLHQPNDILGTLCKCVRYPHPCQANNKADATFCELSYNVDDVYLSALAIPNQIARFQGQEFEEGTHHPRVKRVFQKENQDGQIVNDL